MPKMTYPVRKKKLDNLMSRCKKHYWHLGCSATPGNMFTDGQWSWQEVGCEDCDVSFILITYINNGRLYQRKLIPGKNVDDFIEKNVDMGKLRTPKNKRRKG
jgi:hypothetical protein